MNTNEQPSNEEPLSLGDRWADNISAFGGSWRFVGIFAGFLLLWMIWNSAPFLPRFDLAPFILLNLILSFTAAFQAPIIMMSQNRHAEVEKKHKEAQAAKDRAVMAHLVATEEKRLQDTEAILAEVRRVREVICPEVTPAGPEVTL